MKKEIEKANAEFDRIRIDLKDLYLNEVPIIKNSDKFILYGKHFKEFEHFLILTKFSMKLYT